MARFQQTLGNIARNIGGLTVSQRLAVLLGALLVGGSVLWIGQWAASPEMTPLLDMPLSTEDLARVSGGLAAIGEPHRVDGSRILVSGAANKAVLLAQLEQMDKMPSDTSLGFSQMVKESNPWLPREENTRRWTVALTTELQRVLRQLAGVGKAEVFLNLNERDRGFSRAPTESRASVMLTMKGGENVPRNLALSAARLVSGAVRGLPLKNVEVVDGNGRAALEWDAESADSASGLQRLQKQVESEIARKIAGQLDFDRKLRVNVQVVLDHASKTEASQTPVEGVKTEETTSETATARGRPNGQAGLEPNVGAVAASSPDTETTSNSTSEARYQPGVTNTTSNSPAGSIKQIYAAINLSHSYLAATFKRSNPDAKEPTEADLQKVFEKLKTKIENQAAKLVLPPDPKQVAVDWYYDAPTEDPTSTPGTAEASFDIARKYGPAGGLALLALLALGLTLRLARQKDTGDALGLELGLPKDAIEAARRAAEDLQRHVGETTATTTGGVARSGTTLVGPAGGPSGMSPLPLGQAAEGVLEARELDDSAMQIHTMIDQMSRMVQEDEDAVAALVEKLVDRGRGGA